MVLKTILSLEMSKDFLTSQKSIPFRSLQGQKKKKNGTAVLFLPGVKKNTTSGIVLLILS